MFLGRRYAMTAMSTIFSPLFIVVRRFLMMPLALFMCFLFSPVPVPWPMFVYLTSTVRSAGGPPQLSRGLRWSLADSSVDLPLDRPGFTTAHVPSGRARRRGPVRGAAVVHQHQLLGGALRYLKGATLVQGAIDGAGSPQGRHQKLRLAGRGWIHRP